MTCLFYGTSSEQKARRIQKAIAIKCKHASGSSGRGRREWEREGKAVCHMLTYRLQESKTYENAAAIAAAGGAAGAGAGTGAGAAGAGNAGGTGAASAATAAQPQRPAHAKEYSFLDMELKYGFLQVSLEYTNPCVFLYISLSLPRRSSPKLCRICTIPVT